MVNELAIGFKSIVLNIKVEKISFIAKLMKLMLFQKFAFKHIEQGQSEIKNLCHIKSSSYVTLITRFFLHSKDSVLSFASIKVSLFSTGVNFLPRKNLTCYLLDFRLKSILSKLYGRLCDTRGKGGRICRSALFIGVEGNLYGVKVHITAKKM